MDVMESARKVLEFFVSAAGLSVVVVFVTQLVKNYLKLEDLHARILAAVVAAVVGVAAFFGLKYEVYVYLEEYWPLVVALVGAIFGGAHLLYNKMPTTNGEE
jgi:hypothetical protein